MYSSRPRRVKQKKVKVVRFLHTADLHLGMRITRFGDAAAVKIVEKRLECLEHILQVAKARNVDFVVMAGDLFDDACVDKVTAMRAYEMLSEKSPCPVFVLPGNHDPLLPGSVWDRTPWKEAREPVVVLRERKEYDGPGGAKIVAAPLEWRRSPADPLDWASKEGETSAVRIGVAHGSLSDIGVPIEKDDNPISAATIAAAKLDYLALGHWHGMRHYSDLRAAYSGTPEPLGFPGIDARELGWEGSKEAYAAGGEDGNVLIVTVRKGEKPVIEPVRVARLVWRRELHPITPQTNWGISVIDHFALLPEQERTVVHLTLEGEIAPEEYHRLEELAQILEGRYFASELQKSRLELSPAERDITEVMGTGVLKKVYDELQTRAAEDRAAKRALSLLYRLAKEARG
jgi:DNA repair exonuclease SbcCD nuclease subunit